MLIGSENSSTDLAPNTNQEISGPERSRAKLTLGIGPVVITSS